MKLEICESFEFKFEAFFLTQKQIYRDQNLKADMILLGPIIILVIIIMLRFVKNTTPFRSFKKDL